MAEERKRKPKRSRAQTTATAASATDDGTRPLPRKRRISNNIRQSLDDRMAALERVMNGTGEGTLQEKRVQNINKFKDHLEKLTERQNEYLQRHGKPTLPGVNTVDDRAKLTKERRLLRYRAEREIAEEKEQERRRREEEEQKLAQSRKFATLRPVLDSTKLKGDISRFYSFMCLVAGNLGRTVADVIDQDKFFSLQATNNIALTPSRVRALQMGSREAFLQYAHTHGHAPRELQIAVDNYRRGIISPSSFSDELNATKDGASEIRVFGKLMKDFALTGVTAAWTSVYMIRARLMGDFEKRALYDFERERFPDLVRPLSYSATFRSLIQEPTNAVGNYFAKVVAWEMVKTGLMDSWPNMHSLATLHLQAQDAMSLLMYALFGLRAFRYKSIRGGTLK